MKKVWKWIIGIVIVLLILAVVMGVVLMFRSHQLANVGWGVRTRLPGVMPFGRGWMMRGPGMMGYGRMMPFGGLLGGLFSLGLLALVVLGIVWLVRRLMVPKTAPAPVLTCRHCGEPIQAGWVACPHCGKKL